MNSTPVSAPMSRGWYRMLMTAEPPAGSPCGVLNGCSSNSVVVDGSSWTPVIVTALAPVL